LTRNGPSTTFLNLADTHNDDTDDRPELYQDLDEVPAPAVLLDIGLVNFDLGVALSQEAKGLGSLPACFVASDCHQ